MIMIQIGAGTPRMALTPMSRATGEFTVNDWVPDHRFTAPVRPVIEASVTTKNDSRNRPIRPPLTIAPSTDPKIRVSSTAGQPGTPPEIIFTSKIPQSEELGL